MSKPSIVILFIALLSVNFNYSQSKSFTSVEIQPIIQDSTVNVRALEVLKKDESIVFLTSDGRVGFYNENYEINTLVESIEASNNTLELNFRSLSAREKHGYGITIGNPARIYKIGKPSTLVYEEVHPNVFYDALEFWNDREGIAVGDPTENCMSIIITRDGGETWNKISCENLPKAVEGEAAFAASDTNIAIIGNKTWVATGGMASRILYSPNKGKTWQVFETPIVQGKPTTGIYSIDFYDDLNGFGFGGDYTQPDRDRKNKIRTRDGGKTWQLVAVGESPGYRSCVQYVPNSNAKALVAVGFKGIDYSSDAGETWTHLSDESFYTIRFLNDSVAYAAGHGKVAKLGFKTE